MTKTSATWCSPVREVSETDWAAAIPYMTPDELKFVQSVINTLKAVWEPLGGPQTLAFESTADVIGYGGAAGGGKTDLLCGKALTQHQKTLILRREATQLTGVIDRFTELIGNKDGYNGQDKIWRLKGDDRNPYRQIEFGSTPHLDDWNKYQGRPHDYLAFDEAANFLEQQVRALLGWVRSVDPKQKCQALLTFNPPTTVEGQWIIDFFAPWIDDKYPNPAEYGEIRWFAMINGKETEVEDKYSFVIDDNGRRLYEYDPKQYKPTQIIEPKSRTFISARITDNPYLMGTGYMAQLQALPEPLRSQMLDGDFKVGMTDDPWQVIPTAWVDAAMARWVDLYPKPPMDSMGIDVARGGKDNTVIARRHGMWFDKILTYPGTETPDGPVVAGLTISACRDRAPQHIDVIGVGSSPYDFLRNSNQPVVGINVGEKALGTDQSGLLTFANLRSQLWWMMREALDPTNNTGIALPPDKDLRRELCTPTWRPEGKVVKVQSREEILEKIGRSVDRATAVILALIDTPKENDWFGPDSVHGGSDEPYDPLENI